MNKFMDPYNPCLKEGDELCGYCLKRIVELKEIDSFFYELEHKATGATHIHISRKDKDNTFSVAFKTVPSDSTGVAHILEHTVLCGSGKFPVRDPFFSMLKRSLNTFMNAFTASDWTMYPFSTQNRKDFYNLMDVYLDSAFFPNLDELSFKQEGHRLEFDKAIEEIDFQNRDSFGLVYKGVVYNEMKGAMSSPDQVMGRSLLKVLYPSTTYSNNSGGDPAVIPQLTHEQLKAFHGRHYHPSNAFFYTYGDLPLKDHLSFIQDKVLNGFERIDPKTQVPSQPRWNKPKKETCPYPLGKNEDPSKKCQACVAWLAADIKDSFEVLVLSLVSEILLGNAASPLRKALIDSELGTALSDGTGFDSDNRDTMFACGLKDVEKNAAEKIEKIIFDVLKNLAENGIDKELIDSAVHQFEFHRKEVTNTPYPYGIRLLLTFCGNWFHGGDPERILEFDTDLKRLRDELAKGPFLENKIKEYFLDNPHRVLFTLVPDQLMEQKENRRVTEEINNIKANMTLSDFEKIKRDATALIDLQEAEEDISCLPTLEIKDIPPEIKIVEAAASDAPAEVVCYDQPTSGIFYFSSAVGTGGLPEKLVPLVPFFCSAFSRMGTALRDYAELARLIDAYTGGIGLSCHARTPFDGTDGACLPFITFGGKCLERNQDRMFEIIQELLFKFDFSDQVRLKSLLVEYRAGMESMIVHNGHRFALSLASRNFSSTGALDETWHGIHQLQTIKRMTDDFSDAALKSISDDLTAMAEILFKRNNFKMALIGEQSALPKAVAAASSIHESLDKGETDGFLFSKMNPEEDVPREGWGTSSAVSFVASSFKTVRMAHEDAPALSVISKMLRSMYLHREIREKGGAYGGFALYNSEDGLFSFASYRDPHICATLDAFDGAGSFIRSGDYDDEDIKEAILQVCSEIDKPDTPAAEARKAFYRKIIGLSDEARRRFKEQLLGLTRDKVMAVAEKYFDSGSGKKAVAVISGEEKLNEENKKLPDNPLKVYRI